MGRLLTITATGQARPGIRKRTLTGTGVKVGPITVHLVLIVACTCLGLFYLVQSNRVSTANLELKEMEAKKAQIVEKNERLSTEAARLQSIQQIKKSAEAQKLQESGKASAYAG